MKYHFYKLPYPIATLDIECMSFHHDAVIDEISVIVTNFLPVNIDRPLDLLLFSSRERGRTGGWTDMSAVGRTWHPDFAWQVLSGRKIAQKTIEFRDTVSRAGPLQCDFKTLNAERLQTRPKDVAQRMRAFLDDKVLAAEEVWINHPEFDVSKMETLFSHPEVDEWPVWHYRKTENVATVKTFCKRASGDPDMFKSAPSRPQTEADPFEVQVHTSIGDCMYNLWVLGKAGYLSGGELLELEI